MAKNQEATIKISKTTHFDLKVLKAKGSFKSYDDLINDMVKEWSKNEEE